MVWAAVLLAHVLQLSFLSWALVDRLNLSAFLTIRIIFTWFMVFRHRLVAGNWIVRLFAKLLRPHTILIKVLLIITAAGEVIWVALFTVPRIYNSLLLAAFFLYLAFCIPKPSPKEKARVKIGLGEVVLLGISVVLSLAMCELAVRLLVPPRPSADKPFWAPHPRALYCMKKSGSITQTNIEFTTTYVTSAQGFRDHDYGPKGDSTYRILCLGDSYTMGTGVELEETFPKVLERLLFRTKPKKNA